jgi:hypothetical protein
MNRHVFGDGNLTLLFIQGAVQRLGLFSYSLSLLHNGNEWPEMFLGVTFSKSQSHSS